jgi:hypothetical protein
MACLINEPLCLINIQSFCNSYVNFWIHMFLSKLTPPISSWNTIIEWWVLSSCDFSHLQFELLNLHVQNPND